ncbi:MAG: hypothetical protein CL489_03215 [Acidobacteria bacterium]|nr:hypothetical protein [Acidobacteriota bacterium]
MAKDKEEEPQAPPVSTGGRPRPPVDPDTVVVWDPRSDGVEGHGRPRPAAGAPEPSLDLPGGEIAIAPGDDVPGQVRLFPGDAGSEVEVWQGICNEILMESDLADADDLILATDGDYGDLTTATTSKVQEILGVEVTGSVDGDTWAAVLNE